MDHMGKEMALVQQADKPSSVNLIYSLRWKIKSDLGEICSKDYFL